MGLVDSTNIVYVFSKGVQGKGKEFFCWDLGVADFVNVAEESSKTETDLGPFNEGRCFCGYVLLFWGLWGRFRSAVISL